MDERASKARYQQAIQYFQDGAYGESLIVLYELNQVFPDSKHILLPIAKNLKELGRENEAIATCDNLIDLFEDAEAIELKRVIEASMPDTDMPADSSSLDYERAASSAPVPKGHKTDWGAWGGRTLKLLAVIVFAGIGYLGISGQLELNSGNSSESEDVDSSEVTAPDSDAKSVEDDPILGMKKQVIRARGGGAKTIHGYRIVEAAKPKSFSMWVFGAIIGFFVHVILSFIILSFVDKLPDDSTFGNVNHIARISLITILLCYIPVVGILVGTIFIANAYDLDFKEICTFFVMAMIALSF